MKILQENAESAETEEIATKNTKDTKVGKESVEDWPSQKEYQKPQEPTTIITLDGVGPVRKRRIPLRESQAVQESMGLAKIERPTLMRLAQLGIDAEAIGVSKVTSGSMLATYEGLCEVMEAVRGRLDESLDIEQLTNLAQAFSALAKAQAAVTKAGGSVTIPTEKNKGRRSFTKGAQIGPMVEVKAQAA